MLCFCLDISLFVGARSNVGQFDWFWKNRTIITDDAFPEANASVCQQTTWPLTYDDGVN